MKIGLYEPLNTLKSIASALWIVDGPIVRMSAPFGMSAPFSTRMTMVQLADGGLWCNSPIAPDNALFAALDSLGPVCHLVSPNKLHYTHINAWKKRYPRALAWASPGVLESAAEQHIEVNFEADLDDGPPPAWSGQIDQLRFRGSRFMEETVFFHRRTATLILTDLIENFEADKLNGIQRWLARLGGVLAPNGQAPLDMRMTFIGRKTDARPCLARMLAWQPQRIILAHGRCYLENGGAELRRAFNWLR